MIIHKGAKYTITADGPIASKSDGTSKREMKYYPERDISAIAGEIDELIVWHILRDIAFQIPMHPNARVSAGHILIGDDGFVLSEWSEGSDVRFEAPEGYEPVWALAATAFYVFLGCHIFRGQGGKFQSAATPLPTLRRSLPELSKLIKQCLEFNPDNRPKLEDIVKIADQNIERSRMSREELPPLKLAARPRMDVDDIDLLWPEEMI